MIYNSDIVVYRENLKTAYPKSDNIMPKSDTVKARMFKHNLKSKF